jgi:predicted Co/Zn/Cd cation transporter (cation efflux family)
MKTTNGTSKKLKKKKKEQKKMREYITKVGNTRFIEHTVRVSLNAVIARKEHELIVGTLCISIAYISTAKMAT